MDKDFGQRTIAVIGAGVTGLAALKVILDSPQYKSGLWHPTVFEAREKIGGIWLPAEPTTNPPLTPQYDSLITNLPHPVMSYMSFPFPPSSHVFPTAHAVQAYLELYARHFNLNAHIRLNTRILSSKFSEENRDRWSLTLSTGDCHDFDHVIVANGHYGVPLYAKIPGLDAWITQGKATHSAWYRNPAQFSSAKKLLVIGGGPSGMDVTTDMVKAGFIIIHSFTEAEPSTDDSANPILKRRVEKFLPEGRVEFQDGTTEEAVDHCILATGYEMSFPFLPGDVLRPEAPPPPTPSLPQLSMMFKSQYHVFPLAHHIFPIHCIIAPTSLMFVGLPHKDAPFPLAEAQALAIVTIMAEPSLLNVPDQAQWLTDRYNTLSSKHTNPDDTHKRWHRLGDDYYPYRDALCKIALEGKDAETYRHLAKPAPDWEKDFFEQKWVLRAVWVGLKKRGEAEAFVRGVGEQNGIDDWIQLLKKMLKMSEKESLLAGPTVSVEAEPLNSL